MTEDQTSRSIGHVDHGKTPLTTSIFSTPEFEQLRKHTHEKQPHRNSLGAAYTGGKAARKIQRRKR